MADHSSTIPPFSRFSRLHFGFKHHSPPSPKKEDDWYIPYNGPYEPPRTSKQEKERDSWGQVINGPDDDDELVHRDLRNRYGGLQDDHKPSNSNYDNRERAHSSVSGRTKSSGAVDPARISISSPRQSNVSYPAYINLDVVNGVGASPMPLQRSAPPETGHRPTGFAQFFSFGARKSSAPTASPTFTGTAPTLSGKSPIHPHSPLRHPSPMSPHPYAYALAPDPGPSQPSTAPLVSNFPTQQNHQRSLGQLRKASISTPNLRESILAGRPPKPRLPKGKDKWLSPETWCDALFLPRPKFKMKDESVWPNRIVSPPGSPISPNAPVSSVIATGVQSRVLAHSRSLAELQERKPPPGFENRNGTLVFKQLPERPPTPPSSAFKPPRQKSWALDDLALPSPIPSLSKVFEDGDQLERDRKQWQAQATKSFQNNLSRNISRARAKSLGGRGHKPRATETPLEFLAARTVLGNQAQMPTVIVSEPRAKEEPNAPRGSHSHKNSLSKTISTLSGKSKAHSRNDSWGKSALKMAKSSAALCGLNGDNGALGTPSVNASVDDFMNISETRHIHLADPATAAEHSSLHSHTGPTPRLGPSPTPSGSGVSDSKVGIALTTSPPASDLSHGTYDVESIRMPTHPYAQGGAYSYRSPNAPSRDLSSPVPESSEHKAPIHRIAPRYGSLGSTRETTDAIHPYAAQASPSYDDEPIVRRLRSDSNASPASKMWAQVAPGVIQEVLPRDFQYSPMIADDQEEQEARRKRDRVSVGEALTLAMFSGSRDSGIGNSEEYPHAPESQRMAPAPRHRTTASAGGSSKSRIPVQYDASRPVYQQTATVATTTFTAEPESYDRPTPPKSDRNDSSGSSGAPPSHTSSPPLSPRPLGPVDDLENFRDLFFKPGRDVRHHGSEHSESSTPWTEGSLRSRRTGSGLTMLARQLSQEFEDMKSEEQTESRSEDKDGLRFVLAEGRRSALSSIEDTQPLRLPHHKIQAFQPSGTIPEDVEASSRASSYMEQLSDENDMALLRLGMVGAESLTPQANLSDRRESQHISYFDVAETDDTIHASAHPTLLKPPQRGQPRESYMTTSTGQSRMSGLSDFPTPPEHLLTPAHASILESFFESSPVTDNDDFKPPESRRMTFGISSASASP